MTAAPTYSISVPVSPRTVRTGNPRAGTRSGPGTTRKVLRACFAVGVKGAASPLVGLEVLVAAALALSLAMLLAIAVVLFVAMACQQPAPTNQPPTTAENVCGETSADCEGQ